MMKPAWLLLCLLIVIEAGAAEKPCASPAWTVDLAGTYHFRPFELVKHPRNEPPLYWKTQQGVAFIAPETLAVYQVQEVDSLPSIQPRDQSGGGGRFVLKIAFLEVATGKEVHTLHLTTTSSSQSRVYPTHEGRFLVVTGQLLRLYSPAFQEMASRSLPSSPTGDNQNWNISVIPPGRRIYAAAHVSEHYLLDSDTLDFVSNPRPSDVAWWPEGNALFPQLRGPGRGVFTPEGNWLVFDLDSDARSCVLAVYANVVQQGSGWTDCKELQVLSPKGRVTWDVRTRGEVTSFVNNGNLLAAAIYHRRANPLDLDLGPKPLRISIYDLGAKSERCSIRIVEPVAGVSNTRFFDLSLAGSIAVAQGNVLSLYPSRENSQRNGCELPPGSAH